MTTGASWTVKEPEICFWGGPEDRAGPSRLWGPQRHKAPPVGEGGGGLGGWKARGHWPMQRGDEGAWGFSPGGVQGRTPRSSGSQGVEGWPGARAREEP